MYTDRVRGRAVIRTVMVMLTAVLISTACLTGPDGSPPPGGTVG